MYRWGGEAWRARASSARQAASSRSTHSAPSSTWSPSCTSGCSCTSCWRQTCGGAGGGQEGGVVRSAAGGGSCSAGRGCLAFLRSRATAAGSCRTARERHRQRVQQSPGREERQAGAAAAPQQALQACLPPLSPVPAACTPWAPRSRHPTPPAAAPRSGAPACRAPRRRRPPGASGRSRRRGSAPCRRARGAAAQRALRLPPPHRPPAATRARHRTGAAGRRPACDGVQASGRGRGGARGRGRGGAAGGAHLDVSRRFLALAGAANARDLHGVRRAGRGHHWRAGRALAGQRLVGGGGSLGRGGACVVRWGLRLPA